MYTKEEEWKAEKARSDSIAKDADKKHQQLADRTALVGPAHTHFLSSACARKRCFDHWKCLASSLQELDKLQSSAKQEVASAQANVRPFPCSCHVRLQAPHDHCLMLHYSR